MTTSETLEPKLHVRTRMRTKNSIILTIGVLAMTAGVASATGGGDAIAPGSLGAALRGGYPALTAEWWTWATGIFPDSPIVDETGELCGQGQHGPVWFLAGSFGGAIGAGTVERACTVPRHNALFLPVFNTLWWVPEDGATAEEVRAIANQQIIVDGLEMQVLVDGQAIEDIFGYRAQSPPGGGQYVVEEGSFSNVVFGVTPAVRTAVADGYWVMLRPLSRGEHTVVILATVPDFDFELNVTYNLTVN